MARWQSSQLREVVNLQILKWLIKHWSNWNFLSQKSVKLEGSTELTKSLLNAIPPDGGFGVLPCFRDCSLFAGQVGNIDSSMGNGASVKNSSLPPSAALTRFVGSYVRNLQRKWRTMSSGETAIQGLKFVYSEIRNTRNNRCLVWRVWFCVVLFNDTWSQ